MFFKSVIALTLLASLSADEPTECILKDKQIFESRSVFFVEENGIFSLLMQDSVPSNAHLHVVCTDRTLDTYTCKDKAFDKTVTSHNCVPEKELNSTVEVINNDEFCCAPRINYRVGYRYKEEHHELYRSCFDPMTKSPVFSTHKKYHFIIGAPKPKDTSFGMEPVVTLKEANAFQRSNSLETILTLIDKKEKYSEDEKKIFDIDRGHLAPSEDFIFAKYRRDTYRYVNIVPQFAKNNQGNWNKMEDFVIHQSKKKITGLKKKQPRPRTSFQIITGGHEVLHLDHNTPARGEIPMYLLSYVSSKDPDKKINGFPIPKWIYKVVSDGGVCTIYVTYNNVLDEPTPVRMCMEVDCPKELSKKIVEGRPAGEIYCCDVIDFKEKNIVPNLDICITHNVYNVVQI